jgi:hypothetical protein
LFGDFYRIIFGESALLPARFGGVRGPQFPVRCVLAVCSRAAVCLPAELLSMLNSKVDELEGLDMVASNYQQGRLICIEVVSAPAIG